jgi:hypothetical protein
MQEDSAIPDAAPEIVPPESDPREQDAPRPAAAAEQPPYLTYLAETGSVEIQRQIIAFRLLRD